MSVVVQDHVFLLQSLANDDVKEEKTQRISAEIDIELARLNCLNFDVINFE